jgi:hypothetical protein
VDDFIEVECNFIPKKIVGYGATSIVYKAYMSSNPNEDLDDS